MLNNQLYNALQKAFGKVTVFSRGEPATYTVRRTTSLDKGGRDWAENVHGGEHYEVTCPLCGMHKLWFSYLAGTVVTCKSAAPVWFSDSLMICYYCNGTNSRVARDGIWMKIRKGGEYFNVTEEEAFNGSGMSDVGSDTPSDDDRGVAVAFPTGVGIADESVPQRVKEYLKERGVNPLELQKQCAACWCPNPTGNGIGRIVFPVYKNGTLVGWQGRALPEDCSKKVPKYWTAGSKSNWLFNIDRARWFDDVILVEGVFDCFRAGTQSVCRFGKTTSASQLRMLVNCWSEGSVIILPDMNDPEALPQAQKEIAQWNARKLFKGGAVIAVLPEGKDPGSMEHDRLQAIIKEQTGKEVL